MLLQHGVERLEVREVDAPRHQDGVVESHALDGAQADGAKLRTDLVHQLLPRLRIQRITHRDALVDKRGLLTWMRLERGVDAVVQVSPEAAHHLFVAPPRQHLVGS
jgi:hypothetical protein